MQKFDYTYSREQYRIYGMKYSKMRLKDLEGGEKNNNNSPK